MKLDFGDLIPLDYTEQLDIILILGDAVPVNQRNKCSDGPPPISNLLRCVPYSSIVIPIPCLVHLKPRFLGVLKGLEGMNISNCSPKSRSHQDRDAVYLAVKECGPVQRVSGEASAEALQLVQQLLSKVILDKRWTKTGICDPFPTTQK